MKVSYNWLKEYLGDAAPTPEKIEELLIFHAFEIDSVEAVEDDIVFDVDVLPNRSSDCLCHRGIAREIASITNTPLTYDPLSIKPALPTIEDISVQIEDTEACPRFSALLIKGVKVEESPAWLQKRLQAIGQRPINNIVDATNYVMFALGQPLHAYDATKFPKTDGSWRFAVRFAKAGETVSLIAEGGKDEDRVVELSGSELLIVDASSDTPIGLAGVKGGRYAGVDADTTDVIIEAAHFSPALTRKTARRLGIVIDASKRFENEPSRELPPYAQHMIADLITKIAGGTVQGFMDIFPQPQAQPAVTVRFERVNQLLGVSLSQEQVVELVSRTGAQVEVADDYLTAIASFERTDLQIEEDYIEEVGRLYGYEHVAAVVPEVVPLTEINKRHYYSEKVRHHLIEAGFSEVITSSFRKKDTIELQNALASDKRFLRSSLVKNITEALDHNARLTDLLGTPDTRLFEIGTVFFPGGDNGVSERVMLALGVRAKPSGYSGKEDALLQDAKREVEALLGVPITWGIHKGVAECDFSALLQTLPDPNAYEPVVPAADVRYQPFSVYPYVSRDIALWVTEGTDAAAVDAVLTEAAGKLLVRSTLFDEFSKDGRTSYAFRLVFQSHERTLTDGEVNKTMEAVTKTAEKQGWEVR